MTASASEKKTKRLEKNEGDEVDERNEADGTDPVDESLEPFLEGDHETRMTFDSGGFPLYVKAAWAVFVVSVSYYMYVYALPDLTAWGSP